MSAPVVCTAISANYLAGARVLAASLRRFHPELAFRVLLADQEPTCRAATAAGLDIVRLAELGVPELATMLRNYDQVQMLTALKPAIVRHLLDQGHDAVLYLDADMLVTGSLTPLLNAVVRHDLCLTPHIGRAPSSARREDCERTLLLAGMYNAGFVGVANREPARRFVSWWEQRQRTHSSGQVAQGFHYDQRWLDLGPSFVADTLLIRDPGCNVGHWSLPETVVVRAANGYRANDSELRLFHFSGFDPLAPALVSRHAPGLRVEESGVPVELFAEYARQLLAAGWEQSRKAPWPWARRAGWRGWFRRRGKLA